ncbi:alanyl-tRNA synthetase [Chitinophaga sp. 30R24]
METDISKKEKIIRWIKKIGFWGFIFFLVKGLLWLALGYWGIKWLR